MRKNRTPRTITAGTLIAAALTLGITGCVRDSDSVRSEFTAGVGEAPNEEGVCGFGSTTPEMRESLPNPLFPFLGTEDYSDM